jgi:tryptophan-rich sensory protein
MTALCDDNCMYEPADILQMAGNVHWMGVIFFRNRLPTLNSTELLLLLVVVVVVVVVVLMALEPIAILYLHT